MEGIKQNNTEKVKTARALKVAQNAGFEPTINTGLNISFKSPGIYNSSESPGSGNFITDFTDRKEGMVQRIYHFANTYTGETAPTFPQNWFNIGPGTYNLGAVNIIEAQWVEGRGGSKIEYSIMQPTLVTNTFGWVDSFNDGNHKIWLWTALHGDETDPVYYQPNAGFAGQADMIIKGTPGTTVWVKVDADYYPNEFTITYTDSAGVGTSHTMNQQSAQTFTYTIS